MSSYIWRDIASCRSPSLRPFIACQVDRGSKWQGQTGLGGVLWLRRWGGLVQPPRGATELVFVHSFFTSSLPLFASCESAFVRLRPIVLVGLARAISEQHSSILTTPWPSKSSQPEARLGWSRGDGFDVGMRVVMGLLRYIELFAWLQTYSCWESSLWASCPLRKCVGALHRDALFIAPCLGLCHPLSVVLLFVAFPCIRASRARISPSGQYLLG